MMEVKGVPPRSVLARATRRKVFFDEDYRPIIVPNSKGKMRVPSAKNLADMINTQDADFVDFIDVSTIFYISRWMKSEVVFDVTLFVLILEMHRVEN